MAAGQMYANPRYRDHIFVEVPTPFGEDPEAMRAWWMNRAPGAWGHANHGITVLPRGEFIPLTPEPL